MGMWISTDYMIVPKTEFESWKKGQIYLDLWHFKFMSKEEYEKEFEDWRKDHKYDIEDEEEIDDIFYDFMEDTRILNYDQWKNYEYDYPEDYTTIEIDDKIVWIRAIYS